MSWILFAGNASPFLLSACRDLIRQVPVSFRDESDSHLLALGGLPETAFGGVWPDEDLAWAVAGIGLTVNDQYTSAFSQQEWAMCMRQSIPSWPRNGHYVAVRKQGDKIEAFTDPLGLRSLFCARKDDALILSSHLPWVQHLSGPAEFDAKAFGSTWLAFNALAPRTGVRGVERLGPGSHLTVKNGQVTISQNPWLPNSDQEEVIEDVLRTLVRPALPTGKRLSLGLSGGLDSRVLLTFAHNAPDIQTHSFGTKQLADVRMAHRLADACDIPLARYGSQPPRPEASMVLLKRHVTQTGPIVPASSTLSLCHFGSLYEDGAWMIDGGFGEIGRRQFFNRLYWRGRREWRRGQTDSLLPFVSIPRADCFIPDVEAAFKAGLREDLASVREAVHNANLTNLADELDLLAVYTRLPYFFGLEQSRLDGLIPNYMPFAQSQTLDAIFQTHPSWRKKGRGYRQIIYHFAPPLISYPLVKGEYTYPYALKGSTGTLYVKLKRRLRHSHLPNAREVFLQSIEHNLMERAFDGDLPAIYDRRKLVRAVDGYYGGDASLGAWLDWWLAFDMWYQELFGAQNGKPV